MELNLTASLLRIGLDGSAVDLLLRVVYANSRLAFLISGSVVCAMVTTHDSVSVASDIDGLESRSSDDGRPADQQLTIVVN